MSTPPTAAEGSSGPSAAALANLITQVQPGQQPVGAPHRRGAGGAARPTKTGTKPPTVSSDGDKVKTGGKKKKKVQASKAADSNPVAADPAEVPTNPADGTVAAGKQQQDAIAAAARQAAADLQAQTNGGAKSTAAGSEGSNADPTMKTTMGTPDALSTSSPVTTTTAAAPSATTVPAPNTALGAAAVSPRTTSKAKSSTAVQPQPPVSASNVAAHGDASTAAAAKRKREAAAAAPPTAASRSAAGTSRNASSGGGGPLSALLAFLTCSSGASTKAMAASDKAAAGPREKRAVDASATTASSSADSTWKPPSAAAAPASPPAATKKTAGVAAAGTAAGVASLKPKSSTTAGGLSPLPRSSPRASSDLNRSAAGSGTANNTTGVAATHGGTILPREETADVLSGAVMPPGASFVTVDHDAAGDSSNVTTGANGGRPKSFRHPAASSRRSSYLAATGDEEMATSGGSKRQSKALDADGHAVASDDQEDDEEDDEEEEEDEEEEDEDAEEELMDDDEYYDDEQRLIMQGGAGIPKDENGNSIPLLAPIGPLDTGRKCLVLDLDETLVHSSFKMIQNADFIVPVEIEGTVHNVYVIKRPGVDEFMRQMGEVFEVVVFTASLSKYADPVLDILDIHQVVRHRLFRESCYNHKGNYVKDLSQLGRDIAETIIIDNSPASYIFHPNNAVPISSWFNDLHDTELTDLCPFLTDLSHVDDVRAVLAVGL